jgi:hypothetical protein
MRPHAPRQERAGFVNVLKTLQNPYALVCQGFIVGGLLFWTTQGEAGTPAAPAPIASVIAAR